MWSDDGFRGAAEGRLAAVRSEDDYRSEGRFEGARQIGEGFEVKHVDL